jgi:hypothetical protein
VSHRHLARGDRRRGDRGRAGEGRAEAAQLAVAKHAADVILIGRDGGPGHARALGDQHTGAAHREGRPVPVDEAEAGGGEEAELASGTGHGDGRELARPDLAVHGIAAGAVELACGRDGRIVLDDAGAPRNVDDLEVAGGLNAPPLTISSADRRAGVPPWAPSGRSNRRG